MSDCKRVSSLISTTDIKPGMLHFSRIRCKQWTCSHCSKILKKQWQKVLLTQLPELSQEWSFHTFTMRPHYHNLPESERAKASAWCIKRNWDRLFKRIRRIVQGAQYVRVIEQHKSGCLHVHLLLGRYLDDIKTVYKYGTTEIDYCYSPAVRKACTATGFGYMTSCYNLYGGSGGAVAYVSKYLTKADLTMAEELSKCKIRRIQTSRKIKFDTRAQSQDDKRWVRIKDIRNRDLIEFDVYDMDKKKSVKLDDLQETGYYPPDLLRD